MNEKLDGKIYYKVHGFHSAVDNHNLNQQIQLVDPAKTTLRSI